MKLNIYTNGSFKYPSQGGWAFYVNQTNHKSSGKVNFAKSPTLMEYQAVAKALQYAANKHLNDSIVIHTNLESITSEISHGTMCSSSKKTKMKYLDPTRKEICKSQQLFKNLRFKKVKAHSGVPGNEMANRLAKKAMRMSRTKSKSDRETRFVQGLSKIKPKISYGNIPVNTTLKQTNVSVPKKTNVPKQTNGKTLSKKQQAIYNSKYSKNT